MLRVLVCIAATFMLVTCNENQDEIQAKKLYDMAITYRDAREYTKAVEILQRVRIDYESSEYATRAENEIIEYKKLQDILLNNQKNQIEQTFSRIHQSLDNYRARFLVYPITPSDLEKLPRVRMPEWNDVWGNRILYTPTYSSPDIPRHSPDGYALASFGMDGLPGGQGRDRDHFFKNGRVVSYVIE